MGDDLRTERELSLDFLRVTKPRRSRPHELWARATGSFPITWLSRRCGK
jgi:hypothetical protein